MLYGIAGSEGSVSVGRRLPRAVVMFLLSAAPACAGSLAINYAEVLVENLQPGATCSMTRVAGLPLTLTNKRDVPVKLGLRIVRPPAQEVKSGFEAVPSVFWIALGTNVIEVPAGEQAAVDVVITIPDEDRHLGRRYHADIVVEPLPGQAPGPSLSMSLVGRLLLTVAPVRAEAAAGAGELDLAFRLVPERLVMSDVPLGRPVDVLLPDGGHPAVENGGTGEVRLILRSIDPGTSVLSVEQGYDPCPDPACVAFAEESIRVRGGARHPLGLSLNLPDRPENAGRGFLFLVCVSAGDDGAVALRRYLKIYVTGAGTRVPTERRSGLDIH